ncbi:hypothetical protein FVEG_14708 [Fusarium verticillioides 7600]|uniref:Uncharacterized protein n=1 Tax=Gibberella moniliformis (strain M3125 / FGSC 7600) TaxID=334819 RepID=W7LAX6_GIBM7|nr:hypothetical protein FVEG_14708 [Fusarium verticillioides 7600]EWG36753.1 hypothetical protein FVEG_14708 [Fusarium verticillioides 7600]
MGEIPVNKSNATINSMTALKTVEGSYSLTNLGVSFHERFCSAEHAESYLASIVHEAMKFCHLSVHFTANKHQLKSVYLSTGASSQKKPLRILSSRVTPSRMLVWRVWFCLQDLSSTQDLHTECQGGNSGIQWLSRLLRCFSDFHAAVFFPPSIASYCVVWFMPNAVVCGPTGHQDISTTQSPPTALIHVYCSLEYMYIITRWITDY